ncbi:MAG: hypothetical protein A2Z32_13255 [Chloroflexi bacterium RBG_16_69_14]|nr:MAG: hypothetical protein A2Z32_13255 [Chloroflexi bacterium RBG_16_69_14]
MIDKESPSMRRLIAAILLVAVLAVGGGIIATTAYQAGLSTAVTTATGSAGTVVAPVVVPAYGYGFGHGWNPFGWIFGFFATVFFLFVVFGLLRAIFWRGGPRRGSPGPGGWRGPGWNGTGHGGQGHSPWEARAHETFDDWHRRAHGDPPATGSSDPAPPTGVA